MREIHPDGNSKFTRDEMQQVTTALANMWNNISPQELATVKAQAAKAKAEYEQKKSAFEPSLLKKLARAQKKPKGTIVVEAVGKKPVRARTAYLIYCASHRAEVMKQIHPEVDAKFTRVEMQQVTTKLAGLWNRASAKEKEACKKQAAKELEEYRVLKANYKPPIYGPAKKSSAKGAKGMNKPKKPPTAYLLFAEDLRNRLKVEEPTLDHIEVSKRISAAWKGISLELKRDFQRKADRAAAKAGGLDRLPMMQQPMAPLQGIEMIQAQTYHGILEQ